MWEAAPQPLLSNILSWLAYDHSDRPPDLAVPPPLVSDMVARINGITVPGISGAQVERIVWDWALQA